MTAALSLLSLIAVAAAVQTPASSHVIRIPVEGGNVVVTGPLDAIATQSSPAGRVPQLALRGLAGRSASTQMEQ